MQELPIHNDSLVQTTRSLWLRRGLKLESGAQIADIEATELQVGFRFPPDMKDLYRMVNGYKDCDMNADGSRIHIPVE
jgi:cell wall assembly regulator SMI1